MKCKDGKYRLILLKEPEMDIRDAYLDAGETIESSTSESAECATNTFALPDDLDAKMIVSYCYC